MADFLLLGLLLFYGHGIPASMTAALNRCAAMHGHPLRHMRQVNSAELELAVITAISCSVHLQSLTSLP